ncbi:hypothetical protein ABZV93_04485 [Actinopolymorpha sp. NPDC004070]|uniref:hypothetical protein n=1 Tax=Actinopolymorpha sp. NPDC004070 TaxID=3154548 RepID=UPI0033B78D72
MTDLRVPAVKSDLEYLFDLLSLIPIPTMNREVDGADPEFWRRVAATKGRIRDEETHRSWRRRKPTTTPADRHNRYLRDNEAAGYITSSLGAALTKADRRPLADWTLQDKRYLTQYVLMFFDGERPDLWEVVSERVSMGGGMHPGAAGRRWCQDVCATAWRLWMDSYGAERGEQRLKEMPGLKQ